MSAHWVLTVVILMLSVLTSWKGTHVSVSLDSLEMTKSAWVRWVCVCMWYDNLCQYCMRCQLSKTVQVVMVNGLIAYILPY